jgi:hypothetical protein
MMSVHKQALGTSDFALANRLVLRVHHSRDTQPREYQAAARRFNRYDSQSKIRRLAALESWREFWKP